MTDLDQLLRDDLGREITLREALIRIIDVVQSVMAVSKKTVSITLTSDIFVEFPNNLNWRELAELLRRLGFTVEELEKDGDYTSLKLVNFPKALFQSNLNPKAYIAFNMEG